MRKGTVILMICLIKSLNVAERSIKKGDTVYVNSGEDKGKTGRVLKVLVKEGRALVEGINMVSKSTKPNAKNPQADVEDFREFVHSLGSIPLVLDYKTHDYSTAAISHLPHMIAYSLVNLVQQIDDDNETMKSIAAGGFKDITRIASSSPVMWQNICASNRDQILTLMDKYTALLSELRGYIESSNE